MTAARQDAWTSDEDLVLAELVLAYIRQGNTQLHAFEEAGRKLKRTAAACGFRWNSNIRKKYKEGIDLAKKQRNVNKKDKSTEVKEYSVPGIENKELPTDDSIILSDAILFFQKLENELAAIEKYKQENNQLKNEMLAYKADKEAAFRAMEEMTKEFNQLKDEYRSLITLLDKARKMAGELSDAEKVNAIF